VDAPTTQWLRGVLDLCLLATIDSDPAYGYEMTRRLASAGLEVAGGSIYPALGRLRRDGLIEAYEQPGEGGPTRTYYRTTGQGRAALAGWRSSWTDFTTGVGQVLHTDPAGPTDPGVPAPAAGAARSSREARSSQEARSSHEAEPSQAVEPPPAAHAVPVEKETQS
jgi:PadR family transcriptional regulator, regulatory protein PadR